MASSGAPPKEKRRNSEKRKEKSRDAARCRRSKESEIFSDLAAVLPLPSSVVSHLDKASVMRLVIANLRIMNMIKAMGINEDDIKTDLSDELYLHSIGGIVLVMSLDGDIIYISNNVSTYLGVSQVDLLGQNFFDMVHPCDHQDVRDVLSGKTKISGQASVFVRVKCSQNSKGRIINLKATAYKVMHIVGRFLQIDESPKERFGFVTIATPIPHPVDIETPLGSYTFLSKHSLDMKFTYADERMTEFLGYNPEDLIGESLYNFHHVEDNKEIMKSFKSLFEKGQSETCQYRFMAQGGGYIWVCTQATVLYCEKKNVPLSVVCVNYVISGRHNEIEIYSREQLEWIKEKDPIPAENVTETKTEMLTQTATPPSSTTPLLLSFSIKPEEESPNIQVSRPRPATSEIFAPRTADMNKGFLIFSDDESGITVLKEEPEDLTHLAPTAGDVCVPLSIPPFLDEVMSDILLSEGYSPLLYQDKDCPLFSSSYDDTSRSLSPALGQSSNGYNNLCISSDDGSTVLGDVTVNSILGLDLLETETELNKPGYIDLQGANDLPLLTQSDFIWDVLPPRSPPQNNTLKSETEPLPAFSSLASILQVNDKTLVKTRPEIGERSFVLQHQRINSDYEKRKRNSTLQDETVKKRKHGPILQNKKPSVLMNLLIEGHDASTGYSCFDSRSINAQLCLTSDDH